MELLAKAEEAMERGDLDTAVDLTEKAREADPQSVEALVLLTEVALTDGDFEAALSLAEEAFELAPTNREVQILTAEAALMMEDLDRVAEICEIIIREDPGDFRARHLLAEALLDGGQPVEAGALFETLVEEDEDFVDGWIGLGISRFEQLSYNIALEALEEAKTLAPDSADVFFHIGLVQERMGDAKAAKKSFAKAQELDPDSYPAPLVMSLEDFEGIVEEVLTALPDKLREFMANVPISIEELPSDEELRAADPPLSPRLWGMFRGSSLLDNHPEGTNRVTELPSEIVLYRKNLERGCADREELEEEIRITLLHEIGHYLGWDEDEVAAHDLD